MFFHQKQGSSARKKRRRESAVIYCCVSIKSGCPETKTVKFCDYIWKNHNVLKQEYCYGQIFKGEDGFCPFNLSVCFTKHCALDATCPHFIFFLAVPVCVFFSLTPEIWRFLSCCQGFQVQSHLFVSVCVGESERERDVREATLQTKEHTEMG